jgi:hypothetical protein
VARASAYNITMYILAAFLAIGFICNWLIRPVDERLAMRAEDSAQPARPANREQRAASGAVARVTEGPSLALVAVTWLAVWIPIGWGVWVTLQKAVVLFR